ncbi:taste receptor type 2 member 9-like [Pleurodeles waltl]|uniref:taste receptor type 2 member 9-like n=1 Tax=Pleurodeles waltl TaxID=8319 RepID=UPI003709A170
MVGILASAFIVAVNLLDWARGRSLNTCDFILIALGISGACSQCLQVAELYISNLLVNAYESGHSYKVLFQFLMWNSSCNLWVTASLCIFYCIKIVDFNHRMFIWLKLRISKVVHWLLLGSVVGPLVFTAPMYWYVYITFNPNSTTVMTSISTVSGASLNIQSSYSFVVDALCFCLPLLLGIFSIALILTSLYRHTRRMKENALSFSAPRRGAHIGAARNVGSLLLLNIVLLLTVPLKVIPPSSLLNAVLWTIIASSVPAESVIVILGNTKLKQALYKVLRPFRKGRALR